jgi:twinkle protein
MQIHEVSARLNGSILATLRHLLPAGVVAGSEYCVGGTDGSKGQSLRVHMSGAKIGVWGDFASGEVGGDLIDLWAAVRGVPLSTALDEARSWLGVERPTFVAPKKTYEPPARPKSLTKAQGPVMEWLSARGLSDVTVNAFRVGADADRVVFPFISPTGEPKMIKYRSISDKKDQRPTSANQMPSLFGWQAVSPSAREVWITEGEIDAMSAYEMGVSALSVPFGGGGGAKQQWIENEYDNLDRFQTIYLALDMDDEGQAAAKEIADRLGTHRCLFVTMPKKDMNECLLAGVSIDDIRATAKAQDPDELRSAVEYREAIIKEMFSDDAETAGFASRFRALERRLRFRDAELIILNGINGHGKSQLAGQLSLDAMASDLRVCIASMEMPARRLLSRLTRQAGGVGDMTEPYANAVIDWYAGKLWLFDLVGTAKTTRMLEVFDYARRRYGIDVFVIDNMSKCGIGDDDYNGQKAFMEALCDFKNVSGAIVFLVTHSRKGESEDTPTGKMDVKGSGSITDLADTVLTIWRNKSKEQRMTEARFEGEPPDSLKTEPDSYLTCSKQRNGEWEGRVGLHWNGPSMQFVDDAYSKTHRYVSYLAPVANSDYVSVTG